jgi:hypothetical protein
MAITSVLGGQGRVSDATLTAMLNSGDQDLINRANNYIEGAKKEAEELGKNKGILGVISDLFGFSKLAAAEPPSSQEFSNQFSVTRPSQFDFKPEPIIPGTALTDSVMKDVIDTPTREFGDIRAGFPRQGIFGNVNINPELTEEELIQKFLQTEGGDIETDPFVQQNIFQKGLDFYRESPQTRLGIGALLGGLPGAVASFFAPKVFDTVSEGIGSIFGPRVDMSAVQRGIESARDDDSQEGISSFDAAVSAGIQAAEDDI